MIIIKRNRPSPKPTYIELSKSFAAVGGVKGATRRAIRRVRRAAKSRLENNLVSQEAVDRITGREGKKVKRSILSATKGNRVERAVKSQIGGKSIKGAVNNIKSGISSLGSPIQSTSKPSYHLARVTM